jgi:3-hydroxybutyryl-CoA dehydrogenase
MTQEPDAASPAPQEGRPQPAMKTIAMKTIGVVGAGVMGSGLAQNLAQTGHRVLLQDISQEALDRARDAIRSNVRFSGMLGKKTALAAFPKVSADDAIARITFTTSLDSFGEADFVVENAVEKVDVKEPIYRRLDEVCSPGVVFAANTSCVSITRIGSWTQRPQSILGMHFMNPVPLKDTSEVIRGHHTTDETIATGLAFLAQMGKEGIVVNDMPGFVSNRVLMLTVNEAVYLVQDGVATAEDIDRLFVKCFGHATGPLATADLIGLDTILYSVEVLYESYNDSKYRPCPLLKKMVDAGLLGRKSGQGFFNYGVAG